MAKYELKKVRQIESVMREPLMGNSAVPVFPISCPGTAPHHAIHSLVSLPRGIMVVAYG